MHIQTSFKCSLIATAVLVAAAGTAAAQATPLTAYNAASAESSISGISSGAYMSVQFATAWSSVIKGVGAIAGGPFGCSGGWSSTALSTCMGGAPKADLNALSSLIDTLGNSGAIDDAANIPNQQVYLFNGYNDKIVMRPVSNWLDTIYTARLGNAQSGNLFYQTAIGAGHSQVTLNYGGKCSANGGTYFDDCGYDQAGVILQHIYGALATPNRGKLGGAFLSFSQADFTAPAAPAEYSMGAKAFVYVPDDCANGAACRVHIALHGCKQSFDNIGDEFVQHAGYNAWADTNHIIVLYPQTTPSFLAPPIGPTNPEACWDWWGYLDKDPSSNPRYLTKAAPQIATIKRMLDRLTGGARPGNAVAAADPQVLVATDATDTSIALAWTAVPGATAYEVFRQGSEETGFTAIGTVKGLGFGDKGLTPKTFYQYRVRPILASGPGLFTALVTKATRPPVPRCIDPGTCKVS
nr:PHB depolymerase family esterase [uncultured Rhodopila sp.]